MDKKSLLQSGLIEEYVLGIISPKDRALVEEFMQNDEEVAQKVHEMQGAMENYCKSIVKPAPGHLKKKIAKKIQGADQSMKGNSWVPPIWKSVSRWSIAASILFVAISGFLFVKNQALQNDLNTAKANMANITNEHALLVANFASVQDQVNFLQDVQTSHIHLLGTNRAPKAVAVAYWNTENRKVYLNIVNLPDPPKNKTYQMWADIDGEMVNMGTLKNVQETWLELPYMPHAESLNVTLEKAGGSSSPNVDEIYISGEIDL